MPIATAYIHHNMDKLSRIYPAGSRTDSSNYNPVPMWNVGCQIGTASTLSNPPLSTWLVIVITNITVSLASLSDLVFSGAELPDSFQGDAPKPGSVPAQWCLWLHPETRIYEKPVLSVWSQHTTQRALAQEEGFPHHGELYSRKLLTGMCPLWTH